MRTESLTSDQQRDADPFHLWSPGTRSAYPPLNTEQHHELNEPHTDPLVQQCIPSIPRRKPHTHHNTHTHHHTHIQIKSTEKYTVGKHHGNLQFPVQTKWHKTTNRILTLLCFSMMIRSLSHTPTHAPTHTSWLDLTHTFLAPQSAEGRFHHLPASQGRKLQHAANQAEPEQTAQCVGLNWWREIWK